MSMVAKILVVLNLILAVAVMGAAGAYVNSAENKTAELKSKTAQWDIEKGELKASLAKADANVDSANSRAAAAESQAARSEAEMKTLMTQNNFLSGQVSKQHETLAALTSAQENIRQTLAAANSRNENLQREKEAAEAARRDALDAKNAAETEQKRLQSEVANLTAALDASKSQAAGLAADLDATSTELAMYKDKYAPPTSTGVPAKGVILAADNKMDIYMVSVGGKDGVKVNDTMTVYRGGSFVAEVVVDTVFADKCAVYVKKMGGQALKKGDIQQGDQVSNIL